jgi:FkbM family methyltransferase
MDLRTTGRRTAAAVTRPRALRRLLRTAARSGYLPQPVWRRLPPGQADFVVDVPGGAFRYRIEPEDPFARELFWRGMRAAEGASLGVFAETAMSAHYVLDVGGHTGLYSMAALAAGPDVAVLAFEPVPRNVEGFRQNLRANGWAGRCELRQQAVSDVVGTVPMHIPTGDHPMSASLDPAGFRGLSGQVVDVSATTVDAAVDPDQRIDLIKIDVEGFEHLVLRGMTRTLQRWRPPVQIECNPDGPLAEIEETFLPLGYRFRHLRPGPPVVSNRLQPDPTERYRNFLCVPPSSS